MDPRRAELARIHLAAKQLGLPRDEYEDLMATVCAGVRSAGALDKTGRLRFLAHLELCLSERGIATRARPVKDPLTPRQAAMWSLWMQLADAGEVRERTMKALLAYVERQTGVAHLRFLTDPQEGQVLDTLKMWLKRAPKVQP